MRVLHCPASVGGHAQGLARAERSVGLISESVVFRPSPFGYRADETIFSPGTHPATFEWKRWRLLLRALTSYDVVHFNFGRTILPSLDSLEGLDSLGSGSVVRRIYRTYASLLELRDLKWLKRRGKIVAVTFQGDDARQGDYCKEHFTIEAASEVEPGYYTPAKDKRRRSIIRRFGESADLIYALNPDLLRVLPERARFVPYAHIDLEEWKEVPRPSNAKLVIGHAPTHEGVKGTHYLLEAIERLRSEGLDFEFRLLKGFTHDEMREQLAACDILVDQLLVGWYGGLAVEAMALGCPVVCYLRREDLSRVPTAMVEALPILEAEPASVTAVLRSFLRSTISEQSQARRHSRAFVERWHDPRTIAGEMRADYKKLSLA